MKQFFKNIILIPMAIFTLLLSMGMHVTKIQCDKAIYFLEIETEDGVITKKLILQ